MDIHVDPGSRLAPGRRRLSSESIAAEVDSRSFDALPAGVKSPFELLAAIKKARAPLGLSAAALELLDLLFAFTEPQDWQAGARPIVWPSNRLIADQLGITVSGVQKRIRALVELGLVVMKDAPNGQRRGLRDGERRLIVAESFGFDLAPIALRHDEIVAAGRARLEAFRARQSIRRRGYLLKSAILQAIEAADAEDRWSPAWDALAARATPLFEALEASEDLAHLTAIVERLAEIRTAAESAFAAAEATAEGEATANQAPANEIGKDNLGKTPANVASEQNECRSMGGESSTLKNSTDRTSFILKTGKKARRNESSGEAEASISSAGAVRASIEIEDRLSVQVVIEAVPELGEFMPRVRPDWNDLVEVATALHGHYEISRRNWERALTLLGRPGAALAFAVMAHHHGRGLVTSPGGYFHAMLERAATGELDLLRSYHGMRSRLAKDH